MLLFSNIYIFISLIVLSFVLMKVKLSYDIKIIIISAYSLIVLGFIHLAFVGVVTLVIGLIYLLTLKVKKNKLSIVQFTAVGIIVILIVLVIGKYGKVLIEKLFGSPKIGGFTILAPLGISYFAMKIIQFVLDYRRGIIKDVKILDLAGYILFLPTFAAGPIESYESFKKAYISDYKPDDYGYGLKRIISGFFKKAVITDVLLTNYLMSNINLISGKPALVALVPYITVVLFFLKAYFDLSAYSRHRNRIFETIWI